VDVVIFGAGSFASVVWYMLAHDSPHRVVGFTADRAHCRQDHLHDLPLLPFDAIEPEFPPGQVGLLFAIGAHGVNGLRAQRFGEAKARGYRFPNYVSSRASVWPDLRVGEGTLVFDGATINPFAVIGSNCVLGSGIHVSHHAAVGDHCYFAPNAILAGRVQIGERCFLGSGSVVRDGVKVAPRCLIGTGAVVTADTTENGVYIGVPARRHATPADGYES
jgi:sugar O-acyltransferase (sialic acid O-acetyltransferase NeuD family)